MRGRDVLLSRSGSRREPKSLGISLMKLTAVKVNALALMCWSLRDWLIDGGLFCA